MEKYLNDKWPDLTAGGYVVEETARRSVRSVNTTQETCETKNNKRFLHLLSSQPNERTPSFRKQLSNCCRPHFREERASMDRPEVRQVAEVVEFVGDDGESCCL